MSDTQLQIDLLTEARDLIAQGWTQGDFERYVIDFDDGVSASYHYCTVGASASYHYCTVGALNKAYGKRDDFLSVGFQLAPQWMLTRMPYEVSYELRLARENVLRLLIKLIDPEVTTIQTQIIYSWNDAPGRTQQEVLDLFDAAIAELTLDLPSAPEPVVQEQPERVLVDA